MMAQHVRSFVEVTEVSMCCFKRSILLRSCSQLETKFKVVGSRSTVLLQFLAAGVSILAANPSIIVEI